MDIIWVCGIVAAALLLMYGIRYMKKLNMSFNVRVVTALVVGIIFGAILQLTVKDSALIKKAMSWITLVGSGYVRLKALSGISLHFLYVQSPLLYKNKISEKQQEEF